MGSKYFRIPTVEIQLKNSFSKIPKKVPVFEVDSFREKLTIFNFSIFRQKLGSFTG